MLPGRLWRGSAAWLQHFVERSFGKADRFLPAFMQSRLTQEGASAYAAVRSFILLLGLMPFGLAALGGCVGVAGQAIRRVAVVNRIVFHCSRVGSTTCRCKGMWQAELS